MPTFFREIPENLFLAMVLVFSANGLMAQEKFDYATDIFDRTLKTVAVSINGDSYEQIEIARADLGDGLDTSVLLRQVNKMNDEGWEVTGKHD